MSVTHIFVNARCILGNRVIFKVLSSKQATQKQKCYILIHKFCFSLSERGDCVPNLGSIHILHPKETLHCHDCDSAPSGRVDGLDRSQRASKHGYFPSPILGIQEEMH